MIFGLVLDILLTLLVVYFIRKNRKRKQLRCILDTICFVVALIIAVPLANGLAGFAYQRIFREPLAHDISSVVEETAMIPNLDNDNYIGRLMNALPSTVSNAADSYRTLSDENVLAVRRIITGSSADAAQQIVDIIAAPVLQGIFRAVFCLIFFCGLQYLLRSAASIVENAMYSPERIEEHTVLCGVLGALKGIVVASLCVSIILLVLPALPEILHLSTERLEHSFVFRLFSEQNVLMLFLGNGIYPNSL